MMRRPGQDRRDRGAARARQTSLLESFGSTGSDDQGTTGEIVELLADMGSNWLHLFYLIFGIKMYF